MKNENISCINSQRSHCLSYVGEIKQGGNAGTSRCTTIVEAVKRLGMYSPAASEVSGMAASVHCSIAITRRSSSRYRGKKKGPLRLASSSASSTTRGLRLRIHCEESKKNLNQVKALQPPHAESTTRIGGSTAHRLRLHFCCGVSMRQSVRLEAADS